MIMLLSLCHVSEAALNTLRPNELIFSTGHSIKDAVNEENGMSTPVSSDVCYKETNKTGCNINYGAYYTTFGINPSPGTMNITLKSTPDKPDRVLKVLVKSLMAAPGESLPPSDSGGVDGFTQYNDTTNEACGDTANCYNKKLKMKQSDGTEAPAEACESDCSHNSAYTNFQVGKTRYGKSLWVHKHEDLSVMTIDAYKGVDWSLQPVMAQSIGINAVVSDNNVGDVHITDLIRLQQDVYSRTGILCFEAQGDFGKTDSNDLFDDEWCPSKNQGINEETSKGGLYFEGSVYVDKVFGKIGFVSTGVATGLTNLTNATSQNILLEGMDLKGLPHNVAYIGFVNAKHNIQGTVSYWMTLNDSCTDGYTTSVSDTTKKKVSNFGGFDYQSGANKNASFTFLILQDRDTETYSTITTQNVKFCANATSAGNVSLGVAAYGLPK